MTGIDAPDARTGLPEDRGVGGDAEVAEHVKDVAAADGEAVDHGDDRLRDVADGAVQGLDVHRALSVAYPPCPRSFWSPPEQKARSPAPVSTTTPTERSQRASTKASVSSATVLVRNAFRTSGRLMVIHATPFFFS